MRKIDRKKIAQKRLAQKRREEKNKKKYRAILMRQFNTGTVFSNMLRPSFKDIFSDYDQELFIADLDQQRCEYRNLIMRKF